MAWQLQSGVLPICHAILYGWSEDDLTDALQEAKEVRLQKILPQSIIDSILPSLRMHLNGLPKDILVDEVMEEIEETESVSNGGHEVYIDQNGFISLTMPKREPVLVKGKDDYEYDFNPGDYEQSGWDDDVYLVKED